MRTTIGTAVGALALGSVLGAPLLAQKPAPRPPRTRISAVQASKVAVARYHGTVVGKVPLENEEGKWQYAVTVRTGHKMREVMVDANTGKIASVEAVTAAEEAREATAGAAKTHPSGARKTSHPAKAPKTPKG